MCASRVWCTPAPLCRVCACGSADCTADESQRSGVCPQRHASRTWRQGKADAPVASGLRNTTIPTHCGKAHSGIGTRDQPFPRCCALRGLIALRGRMGWTQTPPRAQRSRRRCTDAHTGVVVERIASALSESVLPLPRARALSLRCRGRSSPFAAALSVRRAPPRCFATGSPPPFAEANRRRPLSLWQGQRRGRRRSLRWTRARLVRHAQASPAALAASSTLQPHDSSHALRRRRDPLAPRDRTHHHTSTRRRGSRSTAAPGTHLRTPRPREPTWTRTHDTNTQADSR